MQIEPELVSRLGPSLNHHYQLGEKKQLQEGATPLLDSKSS